MVNGAPGLIDAFIADHPQYTYQGVEQPSQGATNHVMFARRGEQIVVFKVFCEAERKERECFGLSHWGPTGLVPQLICDAGPTMIVTSYWPGTSLLWTRQREDPDTWRQACRATGRAVAALTRVPLTAADRVAFESRFYADTPTLEGYLTRILELGRGINARDPDFQGGFWRQSLDFVEGELPGLFARPRVLYHQDVNNLHVLAGRFVGFFDLEMCRVGCAAMQLGSTLGMFGDDGAGWQPFAEGWNEAAAHPLDAPGLRAAAAAWHLLQWREISRYLSYDGTRGTGFSWASPADPARYRRSLERVDRILEIRS